MMVEVEWDENVSGRVLLCFNINKSVRIAKLTFNLVTRTRVADPEILGPALC